MRTLAILLLLCAGFASAQDYEREARWKAEVLGNLVVGDAVQIVLPGGREFLGLHAPGGKTAVLLVHGAGVHPDHGVIGSLRMALNDMGYTTLSIQMPVLAADAPGADYHPGLFPEASARIDTAHQWLLRNHPKVVLLSHSLGSWMAQVHLEEVEPRFAAWINLGRGGSVPKLPLPVLDVYGEIDLPAVRHSAPARRATRQVMLAGADHFYTGKEHDLARVLGAFIDEL